MLSPEYEVDSTIRYIFEVYLFVYIMFPCDHDLRPILSKNWLHDPQVVINTFAYLEVYISIIIINIFMWPK